MFLYRRNDDGRRIVPLPDDFFSQSLREKLDATFFNLQSAEFALPAVLTVDEGLNTARLPSLKGIMAAKKKPLDVKPAQLPEPQLVVRKLELPPERKAGRVVGEGSAAVPELVRLLQTEAKVL